MPARPITGTSFTAMSQQFDPRYLYTHSVYAVHPDGRSGSPEKNKGSGSRVGLFVRRKRDGSYENDSTNLTRCLRTGCSNAQSLRFLVAIETVKQFGYKLL